MTLRRAAPQEFVGDHAYSDKSNFARSHEVNGVERLKDVVLQIRKRF
jgi:hypothetical protein